MQEVKFIFKNYPNDEIICNIVPNGVLSTKEL